MKSQKTAIAVLLILLSSLMPILALGQAEETPTEENKLVIYAYDSFVSEWGPGPQVVPLFEEATGITVEIISAGDAGQMVSRAILEKNNPQADIIIGVDNNLLFQAKSAGILESYKSANLDVIPAELQFDPDFMITPYDYGYFSINYDSEKLSNPPMSLEDLTKPEYERSLILMDPRTSSPGLGFLLWTVAVYGDDYLEYWERLKPSILTITDGWDSGYALYTNGEAPMVLTYTTSPPYHVAYEDTTRYLATIFEKGNYLQIEGMGILKGAAHRTEAEAFIDFMLTAPFQDALPMTNFMFPINKNIQEPEAFEYAPEPATILNLDPTFIEENREEIIQKWIEVVAN